MLSARPLWIRFAWWSMRVAVTGVLFAAFVLPELQRLTGVDLALKVRRQVLSLSQFLPLAPRGSAQTEHLRPPERLYDCDEPGCHVARAALRQVGRPYAFGAKGSRATDCSGLVRWALAEAGIEAPSGTRRQFRIGQDVTHRSLIAGDLLFFETWRPGPSHVGLYLGDGVFVHTSSGQGQVVLERMDRPYFRKRFLGARRVVGEDQFATAEPRQ